MSAFNIVDATAFKRDVIKELSEECHREGLKFGVYYSQAQDWSHPDAPISSSLAKLKDLQPQLPAGYKQDMDRYIREKALPQVVELMKNYEIDLVWFDTPVKMTFERAKLFSDAVRKYRPNCLINSRLIHGGPRVIAPENTVLFDYASNRDKEVPNKKVSLYVESPDSVSSSYGYKTKGKPNYHTEKEMIKRLVHTVCTGGNYLLNNGPMGNGQLDPEAVRLYGILGDWLKVNGEAIYDTRSNPFDQRPKWGDVCVSKDGQSLYLHVMNWPKAGSITVDGLASKATSAVYLANGEKAEFVQQGDALTLKLPANALDQYDTVVKVIFTDRIKE